MIPVAAGLITCTDYPNTILLTQRGKTNDPLYGHWEFPGGKKEPSESFEQALARELQEELCLQVTDLQFIASQEHQYKHVHIDLHFYRCRALNPQDIQLTEHSALKWATTEELHSLQLAPADLAVLKFIDWFHS